jgi:cytochrome P450
MRKTSEAIDVGKGWRIPGNRYAVAWSTPAHMDPRVWEDKADGSRPDDTITYPHPTDAFRPARFLKPTGEAGTLQFSLAGLDGSWIPFGSGANICPGRNFAKMHAILTAAMMVDSFDCDVLARPAEIGKLDLSKFGMGVLGPAREIPVRIRRRDR